LLIWNAVDGFQISQNKELIAINIPYQLTYFRNGKPELRSNVVVGKVMNQTVIFSAKNIVFSLIGIYRKHSKQRNSSPEKKNANYLEEHDMEWHGDYVRQKPGPKNSLGLIKFLFPIECDLFIRHPAKSLFIEKIEPSVTAVRVEKPVELAKF
jgi:murein L,D-transpeptidase YcbB/YkuD